MYNVTTGAQLVLASASPRRRDLISALGIKFETCVSNCDEAIKAGESPQQMVERLALEKASIVCAQHPNAWVLGADTTVVIDAQILGKPIDAAEAASMLSSIQGKEHVVWGAFALINLAKRREVVASSSTRVKIKPMSKQAIENYIATGEPMDKAGSYAIQGIGASLVESVSGSYTNVVGLDLSKVVDQMLALGVLQTA